MVNRRMRTTHSLYPALAAPPLPSRALVSAGRGGIPPILWAASCTVDWVLARTTSSCLVSVAVVVALEGAAAKYLGSEAAWLALVVIRMARRCRRRLSWTAKGPVADSKLKIGLIGGAVATVEAVGELVVVVMMVVGVQDSEVVDVALGGMARVEPVGVDVIRVIIIFTFTRSSISSRSCLCSPILFFPWRMLSHMYCSF